MNFKTLVIFAYLTICASTTVADPKPFKKNINDIFNIGHMVSHDNNFTLFFKTREKSVLAKGEEYNYITDYPQDLYYFENNSKKIKPLITYDWFPKKAKLYLNDYDLPIFPEDFAYYLLNDNRTLIMISAIRDRYSTEMVSNLKKEYEKENNFKYDIVNNKLEKFTSKNNIEFLISSISKECGYKSMNDLYECKYYKPLISKNLIN